MSANLRQNSIELLSTYDGSRGTYVNAKSRATHRVSLGNLTQMDTGGINYVGVLGVVSAT